MKGRFVALFAALALVVFATSTVMAQPCCNACSAPCISYQMVPKTIMVPTTVMTQRTIQCIRHRPEVRQRTYTVARCIPETHPVTRNYTIMVPDRRVRQEQYTVRRPVMSQVEQKYTVQVPYQEMRQGVRTVCQQVPVTMTRMVCEDRGHWVTDPCTCCRRWCPNPVQRPVQVTVMRSQQVQVPFQYPVTLCRPEVRSRMVQVCNYVDEPQTRDVHFTVMVPKQVSKTINVTTFRTVHEPRTQSYTVMVPEPYTQTVNVPVCQMVPKTIMCRVPVYPCGGCR